ncbi:MAG TPA: LytTR family DNA-binding domain-containing protein [Rhodanobacteraceae bacterium]
MHVLIVDDEPLARRRLAALLAQCGDVTGVREAGDAETALAACVAAPTDLVLADINMPGMGGTQLARRLAQLPTPPQVVFCTAYEQFAAQAYDLGAADYLLKPVRLERLRMALQRAQRLCAPPAAAETSPMLTVHLAGSEQRISLDDVLYFEAGDKYVSVHHVAGVALTDVSLRQLEQQFPQRLARLHRGCLVPHERLLGLVTATDGQTLVRLAGTDATPPVSRRNLAAVRRLLHGA